MKIVQCGMPRGGSTLLYLMLRSTVNNFVIFDKETQALKISPKYKFISKRPMDLFSYKEILKKHKDTKFIINVRDPRSVLTSLHSHSEGQYKVNWDYSLKTSKNGINGTTKGLKDYWDFMYKVPDATFVYYENLVDNPDKEQVRLQEEIPQLNFNGNFSDFYKHEVPERLEGSLNGIRPPDPSTKYKWQNHPERIKEQINKFPEILDFLIELGYEEDVEWFDEYNK